MSSSSAVILLTEDFETNGNVLTGGSRYLANEHDDGGSDFFVREAYGTANHQLPLNPLGTGGSQAFHGEDVDTGDNTLASGLGVVRLNDLNVAAFGNISVTISFGVSALNTSWEPDDSIRIRSAFDSDSGGTGASVTNLNLGNYSVVGQFIGNNVFNAGPVLDADLNGSIGGGETDALGQNMTDYTFSIPGTGNLLSLEIVVDADGGNEEFAFDTIVISGDMVPEPSGVALIFLSSACLILRRRR